VVRAGTLLVSATELVEPTFRRTVVYIIEHNEAGSLGVVLNRPSDTAVHEVLPRWTDAVAAPRTLFIGGPVKRDAALCLGTVRVGARIEGVSGLRRIDGRVVLVDLDADPERVAPLVEGIRIFAGYAASRATRAGPSGNWKGSWRTTTGSCCRPCRPTRSARAVPTCGRTCCAASRSRCPCSPHTRLNSNATETVYSSKGPKETRHETRQLNRREYG
jgi:hypothetical protein